MRLIIRLFFRFIRLILTPFMLVSEWLTTPKTITRSLEQQAAINAACQQLALYQFAACPFCIKVRKEMARLGLNIEKRDAQRNTQHREALASKGGKIKVPCLLINANAGSAVAASEQQWLYESDEIIHYLRQRFADNSTSY